MRNSRLPGKVSVACLRHAASSASIAGSFALAYFFSGPAVADPALTSQGAPSLTDVAAGRPVGLFPERTGERADKGAEKGDRHRPSHPRLASNAPVTMQSFSRLAKALTPAVADITVIQQTPGMEGGLPHRVREQGTGFLINAEGYVLTNNHVVQHAEEIRVRLQDDREFFGRVVGSDEHTDIALVKIDRGDTGEFTWAPLGDSEDLEIGEWVMAIGNPFGLDHSVTVGIVSAKGRRDVQPGGQRGFFDFIQTDASINPGNSGGPLINTRGEVIGINTAINVAGAGIGFAIPSNIARVIAEQLYRRGRVSRAWLGVFPQPVTETLRRAFGLPDRKGALISEVIGGSPAAAAGIRAGDVILAFDGKQVRRADDLNWLVGVSEARKEPVPVQIVREGRRIQVLAALKEPAVEEAPAPMAAPRERPSALGITVSQMTPVLAQQLNYQASFQDSRKDARGLLVMLVESGSPAMESGVERGDVVLLVNDRPVRTLVDYATAMHEVHGGEMIRLLVRREERKAWRNLWLAFPRR